MKLKVFEEVFEGSMEQTTQKVALTTLVVRKSSTARVSNSTSTDESWVFFPSGTEVVSNPFEIAIDKTTFLIEVYVQKVNGRYCYSALLIQESKTKYLPSGNWHFDHDRNLEKLIFLETKIPWPKKRVLEVFRGRNVRRQLSKLSWL
jgi:hypothetical protein